MTCHHYAALSSEILDGQASPAASELFERHLATCAACASHHQDLVIVTRLLRASDAPSLDPEEEEALFSSLDNDAGSVLGILRRTLSPLALPLRFLASTTGSAFVLLMVVGLLWPHTGALAPVAEPERGDNGAATVFTVWDSKVDRIVASVSTDDSWSPPRPFEPATGDAPAVRIFLFERIVVRG